MLLRIPQRLVVHDKAILQPLILIQVLESLLLNSRAVQDIAAGDDLRGELGAFDEELARLGFYDIADVRWDGKCLWGNELDGDVVVLEQLDERVDGSSVFEITGEGDSQAGDGTELFSDCEQVQECLCRMLLAAIASVEDWYRGELGSSLSTALVRMAENDGITIAAESSNGVCQGFALLCAGVGGRDGDGATTKSLHCCVE